MTYNTFDEWLYEIENYGTRFERFLNEWDDGMNEKRALEWLRAAWMCARQDDVREQFERECE